MTKVKVAVHKFSSCDGCQLALLNLGEGLIALAQLIDIKHFAEAGPLDEQSIVDIAIVEGSIATPEDINRIQQIRKNSSIVVAIGACATAGGIQALRNNQDAQKWLELVYPTPEYIQSLSTSTAISEHIKVDYELWGCPINSQQLVNLIQQLLMGLTPAPQNEKLCLQCKRADNICVMVTEQQACLGAITKTGCGAICPEYGRACYGCYGPSETPSIKNLKSCFYAIGQSKDEIKRKLNHINSTSMDGN